MGLGIKTALLKPFEPLFLYRLPQWRARYFEDTSQHGECLLLNRLVQGDFPKMIVDVGANDGLLHSNSYYFIRRGWRAVLIEPHPRVFASLAQRHAANPRVVCENVACADAPGAKDLFLGADGQAAEFSTLCTDDNEYFRRTRLSESIRVPVSTLTEILKKNNCPPAFGILSVDTEGFDWETLQGLDFSRYRPRVIVTENFAAKDQRKFALLQEQGYALWKKRHVNTIWVNRGRR